MKKFTLFFLSLLCSISIFSQELDLNVAEIEKSLDQYPAFQDCKITVTKDTNNTGLYPVSITYGGKTILAETFKKNNEW